MKMKMSGLIFALIAIGTAGSAAAFGWDVPTQMGLATLAAQMLVPLLGGTIQSSLGTVSFNCDEPKLEDVVRELKSAMQGFKSAQDDVKKLKAEYDAALAKGVDLPADVKADLDRRMTDYNGMKARLDEIEQRAADTSQKQLETKTWGQQFVENDNFADFQKAQGSRSSMRVQVKQVNTVAAGGTAGNGLLTPAYRDGDLVRLQRTELTIEDLLTVINVDSNSIDFAKQTLRDNKAAPVAEGAQKPYSDYAWESATVPVRTLAHLAKLTRQALDDAPRLVGEVDSEMRYGLGLVKEQQYLYGNNTGQNLHGLMPQATAFALPAGVTNASVVMANRVDVLRFAMLNLQVAGAPVDGMVLNPMDWALIELTKDANGGYAFSNPQSGLSLPSMWGRPVIASPAMLADDFLVGAFKIAATAYRRMGVEVLISTENDKDFELNLATMRAEERVALAVKRAWALQKGKFSTAIASLTPPAP